MKNFICIYLSIICFILNNNLSAQKTNPQATTEKGKTGFYDLQIQLDYLKGNSLKIDSNSITIKEQQPKINIIISNSKNSSQENNSSSPVTLTDPVTDISKNDLEQKTGGEKGTLNLDTSKTTNVDNNQDANRGENIDNNRDKNRDRSRDLKRDKNRDRRRDAKRDKNKDRGNRKNKGNDMRIKIKIKNNK